MKKMLFAVITIFLLSGCSQEKAEGLLTLAKSFESNSLQAINTYEDLFKDSIVVNKKSNEEIFNMTSAVIKKYGKDKVSFKQLVNEFNSFDEQGMTDKIEKEFNDIKLLYKKVRETYSSLPQGSLFGAKYISCSKDIVAKAVMQLVNFSVFLNENPLYSDQLKHDVAKYKELIVKNDNTKAKVLLDQISQEVHGYEEKHEETIKQIYLAVEEGKKLHNLLENYANVTLLDILSLTKESFAFVATTNMLDITKINESLTSFKKQFDNDESWKRVSNITILKLGNCKQ